MFLIWFVAIAGVGALTVVAIFALAYTVVIRWIHKEEGE